MRHLLLVGGVVHILGVLFHLALPRLAQWREALQHLPETPRADLPLFNAHVGYALFIFAVLSLGYSRELLATPMGRMIAILIAGFWSLRAVSEFIWPPAVSPLILALCFSMAFIYAVVAVGSSLAV
jgi:hypothetical protein